MKVAILHDWLVTNAGAEKVLRSIIDIYPDADIFSLVDFLNKEQREEVLCRKKSNVSFVQKLPFAKKYFRNYLFLFPKAIESLDLNSYNLIISSSWAVAKGVNKSSSQLHICYCHTPIRYAWDLYNEYTSSISQPKKIVVEKSLQYIREWDLSTTNRVDYFIANSKFVANRINKTYQRNSTLIYPPVNTSIFTVNTKKEDFYLTASRLVPYKKTKLIVEAFNTMNDKKLVVIGHGEEYESIRAIAKDNILILGYQKDKILLEYMQKSRAFIYAAVEDFGITPIEAMSCGTPVIALNDGGTAETVIDGINGIHFQSQTKEHICDAVQRFENMSFDPKLVSKSVQSYSTQRFKDEIKQFIKSKLFK